MNLKKTVLKVLIIEDDESFVFVLKNMLSNIDKFTFEFDVVSSINQAKKLIHLNKYNLVFLDLNLDDSTETETLAQMEEEMAACPFLIVTVNEEEKMLAQTLRKGAQDYIFKGTISSINLEKQIIHALERHKLATKQKQTFLQLQEAQYKKNSIINALDRAYFELEVEFAKSNLLNQVIEHAEETVVIANEMGAIIYVNKAFERVTGYSNEESIGNAFCFYLADYNDVEFRQKIMSVINKGMTWRGRIKNKTKEGKTCEQDACISTIFNNAGKIVNIFSINRDVTREVAMQMQLIQSRKLEAVGRMAAGVAHEINTPVQYINDNITFLRESLGDLANFISNTDGIIFENQGALSKEQRVSGYECIKAEADIEYLFSEIPNALDQSKEGLKKISSIVMALKSLSSSSNQEMSAGDINDLIKNLLSVYSRQVENIAEINFDLCKDLPLVECLVGEISQVVMNILDNARYAVEQKAEKGKIEIKTQIEEDYVVISISNNGIAIPESDIEKIFDPFFTTKNLGEGTGHGLPMAWTSVVDKHKGRLLVDSKPEKTIFTIKLPLNQDILKNRGKNEL